MEELASVLAEPSFIGKRDAEHGANEQRANKKGPSGRDGPQGACGDLVRLNRYLITHIAPRPVGPWL